MSYLKSNGCGQLVTRLCAWPGRPHVSLVPSVKFPAGHELDLVPRPSLLPLASAAGKAWVSGHETRPHALRTDVDRGGRKRMWIYVRLCDDVMAPRRANGGARCRRVLERLHSPWKVSRVATAECFEEPRWV